ncbi:tRNA (adenosine(37)-N6)-threonylcarbamoyltransferase complex ATPase subunit type 1 TsaE [Puia sp.]|jgi:tRNA threonylcarbamoyladenosine biosynthesis protein TsaE|uniref:tRNA (adenosine(37)-N6)-threonylcarbamoyltransferase complex ATPase subunit type 1 TsaE n=1 Tax=Puia sp. TaxID=2045100 RepID=UPI002F400011
MELIFQLQDIEKAAGGFWDAFPLQRIFAFHGNMGAGKTTFIHALCAIRGVTDTVGSPTFSIINEYRYPGGRIYHLDLYRLKDEEEALRAGVEDVLYSGDLCLVEWPDRAPGIFPSDTVHCRLEIVDPETRKITGGEHFR